jgi:hypothetical protein
VLVEQCTKIDMKELAQRHERTLEEDTRPVLSVSVDEDGWLTCPGCGVRYTVRDKRFRAGDGFWQHGCGQRIRVEGGFPH